MAKAELQMDEYRVQITLLKDMLGTNPCDPNVLDKHIINKERKMIMDRNKVNKEVNKYLNALDITKEQRDSEIEALLNKIQETYGIKLTDEQKRDALAGRLETLKETFKEIETTGVTIFYWNEELKRPMIGAHMVYGFLKAAAESHMRTLTKKEQKAGTILRSCSYTQSIINQHVKAETRFLTFDRDLKRSDDSSIYHEQRPLRANTAQGPRVSLAKSEVVPAGAKLDFILKVLPNSPLTFEALLTLFGYGQLKGLGQWRNADWGQFECEVDLVKSVPRPKKDVEEDEVKPAKTKKPKDKKAA